MTSRVVEVAGTVTAITYPGYGLNQEVRVRLDVSGTYLDAIFQSRSSMSAIDIGRALTVRGALVDVDGVPSMYNPTYTIRVADE